MKKKRGAKGLSPICTSLEGLLKHGCPEGFFPWLVQCGSSKGYCFARTKMDALKKVMSHIAVAIPCSVEDIVTASQSGLR